MEMKKICVEAKDENLYPVLDFIKDFLGEQGCSAKIQMMIEVCMEELFVNVSHYAYPNRSGQVEVQVKVDEENVEIVFTDNGIPFNPLVKEDPDITLSTEERKIGGLGIYLVKKKMDEVFYRYEGEKNILTIRKRIK